MIGTKALHLRIEALQEELASKDAELTLARRQLQEAADRPHRYAAEIDNLKRQHATELAAAQASAERRAGEILAQAGHPPIDIPTEAETFDSIQQQFDAMEPGPERSKFYQENKDVLAT